MEISANLFMESLFFVILVICSISEAIDIGDKIGRNRVNQELLREQSSIRQSLKNREDLQQIYSEVHLDSFKVSKSCMIDRYYTQLFAADTSNYPGNDMYTLLVTFMGRSICMHSNTICIVSLAFGHELLVQGKKCVNVEFGVFHSQSLLIHSGERMVEICFRTKSKESERRVASGSKRELFCVQLLAKMAVFTKLPRMLRTAFLFLLICSCIRGRLLEVNSRLLEEPWLLHQKVDINNCLANITYSRVRMDSSVFLSPKSLM